MLKRFGPDITKAFCETNELGLLVRSHQCSSQGYGYTLMHEGYLMRVFSARHYGNKEENAAAILLVGFKNLRGIGTKKRGLVVRAKVIRPPPLKHRSKSNRKLKKVQEVHDSESEDDGPKKASSSMSLGSHDDGVEEAVLAVATKDQTQVKLHDWGVEVDMECDVVNKSEGSGHTFHAQTWQNDDESSSQKLHTDAVVGRAALCGDRFKGPRDSTGQLAGALVERVMELVDIVRKEPFDMLDQQWPGPAEAKGHVFQWMLSSEAVKRITKGEYPSKSMRDLCKAAKDIMLKQQPTALVELRAPVKVFGDVRGHLRDILLFFDEFGRPTVGQGGDIEVVSYIFNGGWVDSAAHQVELILALFALKVTYPERVWLVRGSCEAELPETSPYKANFRDTLEDIFGSDSIAQAVTDEVFEVFDYLPLAVNVENSVLVVHGGIGDGHWNLQQLASTDLPLKPEDIHANTEDARILYNILWSTPVAENVSDEKSHTLHEDGGMAWQSIGSQGSKAEIQSLTHDGAINFTEETSETFCRINGIGLIVRSRQCVQQGFGYSLLHNGRVLRCFSCRNYMGSRNNAAAMLMISYKRMLDKDDRGLVVRAKVITPPTVLESEEAVRSMSVASGFSHRGGRKKSASEYKPISMTDNAEDTDGSPLLARKKSGISCSSCACGPLKGLSQMMKRRRRKTS